MKSLSSAVKVAFVDHEYHRTTKSSDLFYDILAAHHPTNRYGIAPGTSISPTFLAELLSYDLICVWQMESVAKAVAMADPGKLLFVPMYDSCRQLPDKFWSLFSRSRIISFSWTLHQKLRYLGLDSYQTQFFPDPSKFKVADFDGGLRGFAWQRRLEFGIDQVSLLSRGVKWSSFHFHLGIDPDFGQAQEPTAAQIAEMNIHLSRFDAKVNPTADINSNVYFAPRSFEGIGMSFLEAMAKGQCVVAADAPTMNEYIQSGLSGLLYAPEKLEPMEFDIKAVRAMGKVARTHIEHGYQDWKFDRNIRLPEIIFAKSGNGASRTRAEAEFRKPASWAKRGNRIRSHHYPAVTIAIVVKNAAKNIEKTLVSAIGQKFFDKEILVVDGASTDGTQEIIEKYARRIDKFVSEPDAGVFSAMNKAAKLGRGKYIIYMNAGDVFSSSEAIDRAMKVSSGEPDFIIGDHIYSVPGRSEEYHRARNFENTWSELLQGRLSHSWQSGIPCHQSTLTRRALIAKHHYSDHLKLAADHEFMFRMRLSGAKFIHCGECIAIYEAGGMSAQNVRQCVKEWWQIARLYGARPAVDRFFRSHYDTSHEIEPWNVRLAIAWVLGFAAKRLMRR